VQALRVFFEVHAVMRFLANVRSLSFASFAAFLRETLRLKALGCTSIYPCSASGCRIAKSGSLGSRDRNNSAREDRRFVDAAVQRHRSQRANSTAFRFSTARSGIPGTPGNIRVGAAPKRVEQERKSSTPSAAELHFEADDWLVAV